MRIIIYFALMLPLWILGIQPSTATVTTTINVTSVCAPATNWATCINPILSSMSSTGGTLYFPCGTYTLTSPIIIPASTIELQGSGRCTQIVGTGNFDTVQIFGTSPSVQFYDNRIDNIYFNEGNKTGGRTINAANVAEFQMVNLNIDHPWCGPRVHDFNDAIVENVVIYAATGTSRGVGCPAFLVSGGGTGDTGRSDVINFKDFIISGNSKVDRANAHDGLVVDGFVDTVNSVKMYMVNVDGHGLWIRNSIGASEDPQFGTFYGFEGDYNWDAAIYIERGSAYHFTDAMVNGTLSNANIALTSNVKRISFEGGFSSNANRSGFYSLATQVVISNMDIYCNSNPDQGGTAGAYAGILLDSTSRMVTITGNKIGCPVAQTYQKYGIQVVTGADQYTISTNTLEYNSLGGFNGASGTASKVVANNAQ